MNQFEMIAAIVALVLIARIVRDRARLRAQRPPRESEATDALITEVARLRARVEVLERIATDDSRRLAHEIDSLRSPDHAAL